MKYHPKHNVRWIVITSSIAIIVFIIPFFTIAKSDSLSEVFSLAFTAVGTVVSILTLIIGLLILDVYGVKTKFKEREFDNVYELREQLRETRFTVNLGKAIFFLTPYQFEHLKKYSFYETIRSEPIAFEVDTFHNGFGKMKNWSENYFIPEQIKAHLDFLVIYALMAPDADENFVGLGTTNNSDTKWMIPDSKISLEQFLQNLQVLVEKVELQMSQYKVS